MRLFDLFGKNLYQDTINGLEDGIYVFDGDGRIHLSNPAAERLLGWQEKDFVNSRITDFIRLLNKDGSFLEKGSSTFIPAVASGRGDLSEEVLGIHKSGHAYLISAKFGSIGERKNPHAWVVSLRRTADLGLTAAEHAVLTERLHDAFTVMQSFDGILPICSSCKKIRDAGGYWMNIEEYVARWSKAEFSHSLCPVCASKLYPDYFPTTQFDKKISPLDKRTLARHGFASPVEYSFQHDKSYAIHHCLMTDISTEGFGGYFWNDVSVGQEIVIKSKLPVAYQNAVIRWVHKGSDNFSRIGLKFARLSGPSGDI
jgi:PAS domain S-box-containing protein